MQMLTDLISIFPLDMMNKAQEISDGLCLTDITLAIQCISTEDTIVASPQRINEHWFGL